MDHLVAMGLAAAEYDRVIALLEHLSPAQWAAPTDCPAWDVRAMSGHMLGMAEMAASPAEMARQQFEATRRAKREGGSFIDALTAVQVDKNGGLAPAALVERFRAVAPRAARGRRRTPAFVRARTLPGRQEVGGRPETWTVGYLLDVILTRDPFLHRVDITRATGTAIPPSAAHEGRIIDDVVREWAGRHGAPYDLELTGPAGGHWRSGDAEPLRMDALEFCRVLSGRAPGDGLLAEQVPF
jgi:uncharacterized protein (TIGR03083 family)